MTCKIDHYMVDYEAADGRVKFANDVELPDLAIAKALAKAESKKHGSAAVIAYEVDGFVAGGPTYTAVGDIHFSNGIESDRNGCVAA